VTDIYYSQERSGIIRNEGFGLTHAYYGSGVGKTTRVVGLAIRAAGKGFNVDFVQFLKSGKSGEVNIFEKIPNISYRCPGKHPFILSKGPEEVHYKHAEKALEYAYEAIERKVHVLICDEILDTIIFKVLKEKQIIDLIEECKHHVELFMTGRDAPEEIKQKADYITEFVQIKHPYYSGSKARNGIEF
jgi:cob(I)alamin adenosyltransferase